MESSLTREEMQAAEAGMERKVELESEEVERMEEMKGLLRRSRWRGVGRIQPSSDTRWIKSEFGWREFWWRKEEERRAE